MLPVYLDMLTDEVAKMRAEVVGIEPADAELETIENDELETVAAHPALGGPPRGIVDCPSAYAGSLPEKQGRQRSDR